MAKIIAYVCAELSILGLATSASAECAWVLWAGYNNDRGYYELVAAHAKNVDREKHAIGLDAAAKSRGVDDLLYKHIPIFQGTTRFLCLPDPVDPRGPKGITR